VSAQLEALERLQAELLRTLERGGAGVHPQPYLEKAIGIAGRHGFEVIGGGSSRIAIPLGDVAAKLAWQPEGLLLNLNEAVTWLAADPKIRRYFTPGILLSPALVLLQERVEVCGPPLIDYIGLSTEEERQLDLERKLEHDGWKNDIVRLKAALGIKVDGTRWHRLDNFGIRENGRLVAIDFGEKWQPIEACWEIVLRRLENGPLPLTARSVKWLERETLAFSRDPNRARRLDCVGRFPLWAFLERAGASPRETDPCPCGSGVATYGRCPCLKRFEAVSGLDFTRHHALFPSLPPSRFRSIERSLVRGVDVDHHVERKSGRNDPCFCGSGKKFKRCCG
jgi:hypothetical protein